MEQQSLLDILNRFRLVINDQNDQILEWVRHAVQADEPDRKGISQRLGFLAAIQAYAEISDHYIDEWNFVSEEDFHKAISIAGDKFRAYIAQEHIIPNSAEWFDGIKGQLMDKLDETLQSDGFFDQALEKSLEEFNDVIDEEIRNGFDIAVNFIRDLGADDLDVEMSAQFEQEMNEQSEQAEKQGKQVLKNLLNRLGLGPK